MEEAKAVASVKHKRRVKEDGTFVIESEFTLWNKLKALELLGKKLKLFVEKIEVENPQDRAYRELLKQLKSAPEPKEGEQVL